MAKPVRVTGLTTTYPPERLTLAPIAAERGFALIPWATRLENTVNTTTIAMNFAFGTPLFRTIIAKTMLANPRGPNQPRKSFDAAFWPVPASDRKIGSIRITVRLKKA